MNRNRPPPYQEDLELDRLVSSDDEQPDSPIAMQPSDDIRPKWLSDSRQQTRLSSIATLPMRILRPRFTFGYILFTAFALYAFYCLVRGTPLFASPLPPYTGPHGIGAIDLEVPLAGGPQTVAPGVLKSTGEPAFEVETLLATVYYPTDKDFRSRKPRYPWIPRPVSLTGQGYARFAHVDNFIIRPIFTFVLWAIGGSITIPAEVDAPLLTSEKNESFPVTVFSHGMASSRTDYTNFLGELASRGHVLVAIEHRDGSSPGSFVKPSATARPRNVLSFRASDLSDEIDDPAMKRAQLAFRDVEISAGIELLRTINAGKPVVNTRAPITTLENWANRLNLSQLTIGGHSYGATGALQALSTSSPSNPSAGLILDPGKSSGQLNPNVTVPILVVHSNSWSRTVSPFFGRPHFDTVRDLVRAVPAPSWFLTSLGTSHPSVTDAPLLEPMLLSWTTGARLDVKGALKEYVRVADDFSVFVRTGERRGVLKEKMTHEEYGVWVSEQRQKEFPEEMKRYWEVHITPDDQGKGEKTVEQEDIEL
ncbi:platelet-activating factor acetylhydrolase, isoform II-domain-containing protein [Aspergillus karnatakaensis]|uniref:platelet-activating factor acetylhydrolase, isoform II-domain-containing protein n=1 Tax=Aspergillus karnatakaensis TaxID=1810916 RepID=UPI003CCCE648